MNFNRHEKGILLYFTSRLFDSFGVPHFFAARRGGVSRGDFSSLNLSLERKDRELMTDPAPNVRQNLATALSIIGRDETRAAMMKQIHSASVIPATVSCAECFDGVWAFSACDGVFASSDSVVDTLCVKTADCVPILLYDVNNDVACAVHAGWRGSVSGICGAAVAAMTENREAPHIIAAIGPHIGECCYEVNSVVYDAAISEGERLGITREKLEECFTRRYFADREEKFRISLSRLNTLYLEHAGVKSGDIDVCELCTCCSDDEEGSMFFSHRASGGHSGTQLSAVSIRCKE